MKMAPGSVLSTFDLLVVSSTKRRLRPCVVAPTIDLLAQDDLNLPRFRCHKPVNSPNHIQASKIRGSGLKSPPFVLPLVLTHQRSPREMTPLGGSTQEIIGDQIMLLTETEFCSRPIESLIGLLYCPKEGLEEVMLSAK